MIHVFDDIESGKLKDIDFLECYACWAGCANGNLTVDNVYVCQAKLQTLWPSCRRPTRRPRPRWSAATRIEDFSLERPSRRGRTRTPATCATVCAA